MAQKYYIRKDADGVSLRGLRIEGVVVDVRGQVLVGFYVYRLVAISILIAVVAAYAALDLSARIATDQGFGRFAWLSCGAVALGLGIWSMHYMGMEAYRLPGASGV